MHSILKAFSIGLSSFIAACSSTTAPVATQSQPAILITSESSLQTLTDAVSTALNGRTVLLAPNSLTKRPTLIMDPAFPMGPDGNPIMGRSTQRPDHFKLEKRGHTCVLIHEETSKEIVLSGVECVGVETE